MTFSITGQMPSGKNAVKITRTGHRYPNQRFMVWREDALDQLRKPIAGYAKEGAFLPLQSTITLECEYTPGDRRTRDVPGMLDALLHLIVKAGLLTDDGLVWAVTWRRMEMDRKHPRLKFTISEQEGDHV